jgi:gliding motility-associated-like protein
LKNSWLPLLVCVFVTHLASAQAPVAQSNNVVVFEDTPKSIVMLATDPNSDPLTFEIVTYPTFGTLSSIFGSTITYTPDPGYIGPDCFTFKARDGTTFSNKGTVSIDVIPVNDRPIAFDQTIEYDLNTPESITLTGFDDDNDPLTYIVLNQPANGVLTGSGPNRIFTPNTGFNGSTSFTFKVNDGTVDSDPATITFNFNNVANQAPIAENQTVIVMEDQSENISLGASDADGNGLSYSIVSQPTHGSLTGIASAYTYVPDPDYFGPDSFTFNVNDGMVDSNIATVSITVSPVNDLPLSDNKTVTTQEDTPVAITLTAADVESNSLSYSIVTPPAHGMLSCFNCANPTYTPSLNYHGPDSFTYKANDGTVDSNIATVSITVSPVNDAPIANHQSVSVQEDNAEAIALSGSDVEGSVLTFTVLTQPTHGTLAGSGVNYIYTPHANYYGADSFTFKVNDGTIDSNPATVSITVNSVNDTPIANNQSVTVQEDNTKSIVLTGSDTEGNGLTFTIVSPPTHGVLTGSGANYSYTPNANYHGADSFTFTANDGLVDSNIATVSITVTPVNDVPVADDQAVVYLVNGSTSITLTGSDADGDALTYILITQPAHGTLTGSGNTYTYAPGANYNGLDSYTFKVNDGNVDSNIATVSLTASFTNHPPVANDQTVSVNVDEDVSKVIVVVATDLDGDPLTYVIVTPPAHGTITGTGPNYTYTPNLNYNGTDGFTFKANDGTTDSNVATVNIIVNAINDAPVANNQSVTVQEDASGSITLGGSDVEGDALTFTVLTQPAHGVLSGSGANYTYTPNANYNGADSFTFNANDGSVDSNIAMVSIMVSPVNDLPVSTDQTIATPEDTPVVIVLSATDIDGNTLSYTIVTPPAHGTVSCTTCESPTYTPNINYNGTDSFTYKANDGTADSNIAAISITISPVNDAPVADNQSVTVQEDIASVITLGGSDVEGDALSFTVMTQPIHGVLTGSNASYTYTPNANYTGADSFTFKANDGSIDSNIATVSITVSPVNDLPVSADQAIATQEDTPVVITLSASDIDGNTLTYTIVTPSSHGTLSCLNCASPVYTPDLNYHGPDSFTYKANDGTADSNVATVSIAISPVNDVPFANNQNVTLLEDSQKAIVLTGGDVDGDVFTFTVLTQPTHGILTGSGTDYTYTPNLNYDGTDSFTFKTNDGSIDSNIATVTITVSPVNDLPVSADQTIATQEDTPVAILLAATDIDTDIDNSTLTYTTVTPPAHGTLSCLDCANPTYTPDPNYTGADSFTYKANDGTGDSNVATITITISPVNDAPVVQDKTVAVKEDETTSVCFTVTDIENNPSTFTGGVSLDGNGSLVLDPATGQFCFLYTPKSDFFGKDEVEVTVCDANDPTLCSKGIITINVTPVNDLFKVNLLGVPVDTVFTSTPEDTPISVCMNITDPDGDQVSRGSITNVSGGGTLTGGLDGDNTFCLSFTPEKDFNGKSIWEIEFCDNGIPVLCGNITIVIDVTPVNEAPVANDQIVFVVEDTPTVISLQAADVDGDELTSTIIMNPTHGVLSGSGLNLTYTPHLNYAGPDSFTYKVNDGTEDSNIATVSITVTPVNDATVIESIPLITTPEDTEVQICLTVTDVEGDAFTFNLPANISGGGTIVANETSGCFIFRPLKDFNGDSFWKFNVCDSGDPTLCSEREVRIIVTPVNDQPIAANDFITARSYEKTESINLLGNDTDIENDNLILTTTPLAGPSHGTAALSADGFIQYQSSLGYMGADSVRYQVCDNGVPSLCDIAVVFVEVGPAPFKIYQGLSPNNDGLNDYWRIDGIENFPNNRVQIFDRYNNLIFETSGYSNEDNTWRGQTNHSMINGNVTEGTYYYSLNLGDGSDLLSGYVVLKKN